MLTRNKYSTTAVICLSLIALSACGSKPTKAQPIERAISAPLELRTTDRGPALTIDDVLFDFEEASLRPEANSLIRQAAEYLQNNPNRIAIVEGHTDHTGDKSYNQLLSDARSDSVRQQLLRFGVAENRIQAKGYGETQPVATNQTPDGRQANRRVEIVFQKVSRPYSSL